MELIGDPRHHSSLSFHAFKARPHRSLFMRRASALPLPGAVAGDQAQMPIFPFRG
ncbi:hypothetical protein [Rhizobium lentis]|uniref:Uncharacterized protein n=1 Tax=Rhizobium lentis TaxID=1138194 RepID=A0A9Q3MD72_9HYPH|nr:hypothetical protein [Rhizobium lentis]MBX4958965.1 hypothetical protein [Rhizobium lentis]MBX4977144.1 hypothetical protein [Rhizobium lentis]MBX5000698.1 hypothetical protein [Rhizobium lentis]MBX5013773.1 hypothetical protein [Rhizobium lentis]MBX5015630.1 hypothetical protein [Rhizobium lentis]